MQAEFKLPVMSIFHTPDGVNKIKSVGSLNLNQKYSYDTGVIKREIGFEN